MHDLDGLIREIGIHDTNRDCSVLGGDPLPDTKSIFGWSFGITSHKKEICFAIIFGGVAPKNVP